MKRRYFFQFGLIGTLVPLSIACGRKSIAVAAARPRILDQSEGAVAYGSDGTEFVYLPLQGQVTDVDNGIVFDLSDVSLDADAMDFANERTRLAEQALEEAPEEPRSFEDSLSAELEAWQEEQRFEEGGRWSEVAQQILEQQEPAFLTPDPHLGVTLHQPVAVQATEARVHVLDRATHRLLTFDRQGFRLNASAGYGSGNAQLAYPAGMTSGFDGQLYVADTQNHRIAVFDQDGEFLGAFGEGGTESGQLNGPSAIALASDGSLHVGNGGNARLTVFTTRGQWLFDYGHDVVQNPRALVSSPSGEILIADSVQRQFHVFLETGEYAESLDIINPTNGAPLTPLYLALTPFGNVIVSGFES